MSSPEIAQHESTVGRRGFDVVLVALIVTVMALLGLAGAGII